MHCQWCSASGPIRIRVVDEAEERIESQPVCATGLLLPYADEAVWPSYPNSESASTPNHVRPAYLECRLRSKA